MSDLLLSAAIGEKPRRLVLDKYCPSRQFLNCEEKNLPESSGGLLF